MRKLFLIFILLLLTGCGVKEDISQSKNDMATAKILMVVAPKDFRDTEYNEPRKVFTEAGAQVKVASIQSGVATGVEGTRVNIDLVASEAKLEDFDAVVFIGGSGMAEIINDETLEILAKRFYAEDKITAAICVAPAILAQAGVLQGKNATSWSGVRETLEKNGAKFLDQAVVVDGEIITANGPEAAQEFGEEIIRALQ
ncbi:MAG: DJ-1/PfpI family protein [Patescibacteria group bacterium]|nr:DJ-1/PfpI family protein [Patescibacteria group bacterium]